MEVYSSIYTHTTFDKQNSIIHSSWKPASDKLSDADFKNEMHRVLEQIRKFTPTGVLINTKEFKYPVTQHTQDWIAKNFIIEVMDLGVKKYAIVVNESGMPQNKLESLSDAFGDDFSIDYFLDEQSAITWLSKK
jgi:hypothetical protein